MIGLALEGGGAKGAYQVGAYKAFKKLRIKVRAIAGTSIGSFNGAMFASHKEKELESIWRDATMSSLLGIDEKMAMEIVKGNFNIKNIKWTFTELYKIFKNKGLDMSNYRAVVRNNIDEEALRKSNIRFGLTTVKLDNLEPLEVYLEDMAEGSVCDYIVASSYLPIFKKEKLIDDAYYLDGGVYNLCPVDMLEEMGCDKIYTINIKGIGHRKSIKNSKSEIIEIKPYGNLGSIIAFDKETNENNIAYGYNDTMKVFGKLDGNRYTFKKKSERYYKRMNRRVDDDMLKAVMAVLNTNNYKETTIKALEYVLESEKYKDTPIYKTKDVVRVLKSKNKNNLIYKYVGYLKS